MRLNKVITKVTKKKQDDKQSVLYKKSVAKSTNKINKKDKQKI
jgi:hypothetical protein